MPVQINEMVIKANIVEGDQKEGPATATGTGGINKDEIVKECAAMVMEIINNKNQR